MTINIVLATSHAVILGCDSTASVTEHFIDPFAAGIAKDKTGKLKQDKQGRYTVKFKYPQLQEIVTDAWGGVTKMFQLCSGDCKIAAVTSGLATLNGRPIASVAEEFEELQSRKRSTKATSVKDLADEFLAFVRKEYMQHYRGSTLPPEFREGPSFILGGYGKGDSFGSIYRISVKNNAVVRSFAAGEYGISWGAQSDAVERVIRGYDRELRRIVEGEVADAFSKYAASVDTTVLRIVNDILKKLNATMPAGVNTTLPSVSSIKLPWEDAKTTISYGNLPLQDAVDLVSYLIMMQMGKARFARGVGTVGGFTHIGVITRREGFKALKEPELTHQFTGFDHAR